MNVHASAPTATLDAAGLDLLFREGRTFSKFLAKPVDPALLAKAAELAELGPTEANTLPGRFLFLTSADAKAKLNPLLAEGNREKSAEAPVNVIAAYDMAFYENLPKTFPQVDARSWYAGAPAERLAFSAQRSTALQLGYLILAFRALGLDVGPMGGFDAPAVDEAFLAGTTWKSFVVLNVGYGDRSKLYPRNPRLALGEFVKTL